MALTQARRKKVQVWIYTVGPKGSIDVLLLLTRPDRGGFWQPVTGGVESGESPAEAAAREAREETGLKFQTAPFSLERNFSFEKNGIFFREYGFAAEVKKKTDPTLDPKEHTRFEWVDSSLAFRMLHHKSNVEMLEALLRLLLRS